MKALPGRLLAATEEARESFVGMSVVLILETHF
jgi:hypothetical protein